MLRIPSRPRFPNRAIARIVAGTALAALLSLATGRAARADVASNGFGGDIDASTGEAVYQHVCQGCHMPGGTGAVGAAAIPALAGNKKLASSGYPVYVVLNGLGGMPWFNGDLKNPEGAGVLSNQQIALVVNFIRTHFGNAYGDPVSAADVAAVRGPAPITEH